MSRSANHLDDRVQVVERDLVAFQDVFALARFFQQVNRAPAHHVNAVIDEMLDRLHQAHFLGLSVHHGQEDHAEAFLHLRCA